VIAGYERLSQKLMQQGQKEAMLLADIVRDLAASEQGRKPS
jgi:hypothetical protein